MRRRSPGPSGPIEASTQVPNSQAASVIPGVSLPSCIVCGLALTTEQIAIAESRGRAALYCSPRCRGTAKKRASRARKRAKTQHPGADPY